MKTIFIFFSLFLSIIPGIMAQELTLENVLEKYYTAGNFEKLRQVNSIIMTGSIVQQDLMPIKIIRVRPDKYMMEFDLADMTAYQAYDGQTGWMTAPWTGNAAAQIMPPERLKDLKNRAEMDGPLVNWKEKGHFLELIGKDTLEDMLVYKIKIIRNDGGIEYNFIDNTGFMLRKRTSFRMAGGKEVTVENYFRDYRKVDGIPFAFTLETNNGGRVNEIQYETIELNKPIDLEIFSMPDKK